MLEFRVYHCPFPFVRFQAGWLALPHLKRLVMKFIVAVAAVLGAPTAWAAPQSTPRLPFDKRFSRGGPPVLRVGGHASTADGATLYDDNWAGAIAIGSGYNFATGTLVVPEIQLPPGANPHNYYAAVGTVSSI